MSPARARRFPESLHPKTSTLTMNLHSSTMYSVQCIKYKNPKHDLFFQFTDILEDCIMKGDFVPEMRKDHFWVEV